MGGCQNYVPFLDNLNIRGRIIIGTPKKDHNFDNHTYASLQPALRAKSPVASGKVLFLSPYTTLPHELLPFGLTIQSKQPVVWA